MPQWNLATMLEEGEKRGTHLVTSSKGVKMERVLTVEFGFP